MLRYHSNVMDLEKKAEHFSNLNEETYQSIWEMKDQEAREKLQKVSKPFTVLKPVAFSV